MYAVLLVSNSADNPLGQPGNFLRDVRLCGDSLPDDLKALGYALMTKAELEAYQQSIQAEVQTFDAQKEQATQSGNLQKLDALKRLFDDGDAIDDAWATATNAQKFDLVRIAYKILRRNKRSILEEYKPE